MSGHLRDLVSPVQLGNDNQKAREYRRRADELREIAEDIRDDENRLVLLRIAASYDRMASIGDRLAGSVHTHNASTVNGGAGANANNGVDCAHSLAS